MERREDRRDRTIRYGESARRVAQRVHRNWHTRSSAESCRCHKPIGYFFKDKSMGCRCRRRGRDVGPKVANSICHGGGGQYHPCVVERIRGNRLCRAWLSELRGADPYDVDL